MQKRLVGTVKIGLVSCLFACIASPAVFAVDLSDSVEFVAGYDRPYWQSSNGETPTQGTKNFGNNATYGSSNWIRLYTDSGSTFTVAGGNYVSIIGQVVAYSATGGNANTNAMSQPLGVWGVGATIGGTDCHLVDFDYNTYYAYAQTGYQYRYNFEWICRAEGSTNITNPVTNLWVNTTSSGLGGSTQVGMSIQRVTVWKPSAGFDDSAIISRINAVNTNITQLKGKVDTTNDKLDDLIEIAEELADQQAQEQQAMNDAVEDAQDSADDSASDSSTATTSLINTIGGAVAAITGASPTNCKIDGDMGHIDMGELDLCDNPVPSYMSVIGSLILVLAIVPLAIHLFNLFISITRSFQS